MNSIIGSTNVIFYLSYDMKTTLNLVFGDKTLGFYHV